MMHAYVFGFDLALLGVWAMIFVTLLPVAVRATTVWHQAVQIAARSQSNSRP